MYGQIVLIRADVWHPQHRTTIRLDDGDLRLTRRKVEFRANTGGHSWQRRKSFRCELGNLILGPSKLNLLSLAVNASFEFGDFRPQNAQIARRLARLVYAQFQEEGNAAEEVRPQLSQIGHAARVLALSQPGPDLIVYVPKFTIEPADLFVEGSIVLDQFGLHPVRPRRSPLEQSRAFVCSALAVSRPRSEGASHTGQTPGTS